MLLPTPRLLCLSLLLAAKSAPSAPLTDDHAITIHSQRDISAKRRALIQYLWGHDGLPAKRMPDLIRTNITSPVKQLEQLARVDEFHFNLAPALESLAFHFIAKKANRELVIVHHGHGCTLDDDPSDKDVGYGLQRTISALLNEGYGVLGVFMPHMRPGDCTGGHDAMFQANPN